MLKKLLSGVLCAYAFGQTIPVPIEGAMEKSLSFADFFGRPIAVRAYRVQNGKIRVTYLDVQDDYRTKKRMDYIIIKHDGIESIVTFAKYHPGFVGKHCEAPESKRRIIDATKEESLSKLYMDAFDRMIK